jgi:hypothetical protein
MVRPGVHINVMREVGKRAGVCRIANSHAERCISIRQNCTLPAEADWDEPQAEP